MRDRAGLSRGEVLLILLMIAVGDALLVTLVSRVREEAARTRCQNNLKQLGLAFHSYHDVQNRLPPLVDQGEGAPTGKGLPSVFATLIPYIESNPWNYNPTRSATDYHAHSSVRFPFHNKDGDPGTLYGGIVNQNWLVFRCPADTTANQLRDIPMTLPDGTTGYYAAGSYAANGMLPWGSGGLKDITRGTATTIMLGERPQVCRTAAGDTVYNLWGVGFYSPHMPAFAALTPIAPPGLWSTGQIAPVMPLPGEQAEDRNTAIHYRVGRKDAPPQAADFPTPIQPLRKDQPCDPRLPGSMHNAGMQVAMADGSVRTFAADTEPWVFWSACAPGGKR